MVECWICKPMVPGSNSVHDTFFLIKRKLFKNCRICIENMFEIAFIQVSFLHFFCCILSKLHFFRVGSFSMSKLH